MVDDQSSYVLLGVALFSLLKSSQVCLGFAARILNLCGVQSIVCHETVLRFPSLQVDLLSARELILLSRPFAITRQQRGRVMQLKSRLPHLITSSALSSLKFAAVWYALHWPLARVLGNLLGAAVYPFRSLFEYCIAATIVDFSCSLRCAAAAASRCTKRARTACSRCRWKDSSSSSSCERDQTPGNASSLLTALPVSADCSCCRSSGT